jgi:hypothetical protein
MRVRKTLESPFDPRYLLEVVREAGFEDVRRLLEVDELVSIDDLRQPFNAIARFLRYRGGHGDINTVVARKPVGLEARSDATNFFGRIESLGDWEDSSDPGEKLIWVEVTNEGHAFWPMATGFPYPSGVVTVGPYAIDDAGERVELGRTMLPHSVSPGSSARVLVRVPGEATLGEVRIDLVREGLAWFSELGSQPLVVPPKG